MGAAPPLELRRVAAGLGVLVGRRCLAVGSLGDAAGLGAWVDFLPAVTRTFFLAQYVEDGQQGLEYCLHYLFRKK